MSPISRWALSASLAASALLTAAPLRAAEPTVQELKQQLQALQQRIDQLETRQLQAPATQPLAARVLADAQNRGPLFAEEASPLTSGWKDGKFLIQSENGDFRLNPYFQFQPRNVTTFRDDAKNGDSDTQSGFELRRMKIGFAGNAFGPDLAYDFLWGTNRKTGALELESAWAKQQLQPVWALRLGQFKDPLGREQTASSTRLIAVDRSLLNEALIVGDDYIQGISAIYGNSKTPLMAEFAFTDGSQSLNTNFQDDPAATTAPQTRPDWGVAGRASYKLFGDWKSYDQFSSLNLKNNLAVLGAGADYTETGGQKTILHTLDAQYNHTSGLGLFAAFLARYSDPLDSGPTTYDWGALGQVSYLLDRKHWEPFLRYDYLSFDDNSLAANLEHDVHEITVGTNYYFRAHAAKITLDLTYLPNGSPISADSLGILPASGQNELVLRLQFQLLL